MRKKIPNPHGEPGERVKYIRTMHGWTQQQLAETIDVEPTHISMIENGNRKLTVEKAKRIAEAFSPTRFQYLMGYDDYRTPTEAILKPLAQETVDKNRQEAALLLLAESLGVDFVQTGDGIPADLESIFSAGIVSKKQKEFILSLSGDVDYSVVRNGVKIGTIDASAYYHYLREMRDFAEYLLEKLCKGVAGNG